MTTSHSSTPRALRLALPAIALLVAWVLWAWLGDEGSGDLDALTGPAADVNRDMHVESLRADDTALDAEPLQPDTPADSLDKPNADEPWPAGIERACLSGRVVDVRGAPWPGARVVFVPDRLTQQDLDNVPVRDVDVRKPLDRGLGLLQGLDHATSDAEGRFQLCGPWQRRDRQRASPWWQLDPSVVISAPGMAWQAHAALGFSGGDHHLGDLVLRHPGASFAVRVVDEQGAPVPSVATRLHTRGYEASSDSDPTPPTRFQNGPFGVTDAAGRLVVEHQWPGSLNLWLEKDGYLPSLLRIPMASGERLDLGEVVLTRGHSVSGSLVDTSGQPIPGGQITALDAQALQDNLGAAPFDVDWSALLVVATRDTRLRASSGADGNFVLSGIPPDMPAVSLIGLAPGHRSGHLLRVAPDDAAVQLVLEPMATLDVTLRDAHTGALLPGAELLAFGRTHAPDAGPAQLHPVFGVPMLPLQVDGRRVLDASALGTLLFTAAPGHLPRRVELPGCAPGERRDVVVELQPGDDVRGRCVDDLGAPVAGARVWLEAAGLLGVLSPRVTHSDADGHFSFPLLPAATWTGTAHERCHARVEFGPLDSNAPSGPLEVVMARGARVTGRVLTAHGEPAAAHWLQATREDQPSATPMSGLAARGAEARIDHQGRFDFAGLLPGRWALQAEPGAEVHVELFAGDNAPLEFVLKPTLLVTGLTRSGMDVLPDVLVSSRPYSADNPFGKPSVSTRSGHHGRFELELPGPGEFLFSFTARDGPQLHQHLVVRPGDRPDLDIDFGTGRLAGRVVYDESLVPGPSRSILLVREGIRVDTTRILPGGLFEFAPLPPGVYELSADLAPYLLVKHGPIELGPGEQRDDLRLEPRGGTRLLGTVRHADGTPFEGFAHLRRTDGAAGYAVSEVEDGEIDFDTVEPGPWRLDLAMFWEEALGLGLRGEPGAELPFYAERVLKLEPLQTVELDIVVEWPADG